VRGWNGHPADRLRLIAQVARINEKIPFSIQQTRVINLLNNEVLPGRGPTNPISLQTFLHYSVA